MKEVYDKVMQCIDHIYVVGGGFSGTALAYELIVQSKVEKVFVIEKNKDNLFRGVAYNCHSDNFLLNVKAKDLGFRAENPLDFFEWLNQKFPQKYSENDFVSRNIYGNYLEERISPLLGESIIYIEDEVIDIDLKSKSLIGLKSNYTYSKVILAIGGGYVNPLIPADLIRRDDVFIKGTGLSAIDIVIDLYKKNFQGKYHLYSRHGLLPLAHDQGIGDFHISHRLNELFSSIKKIYREKNETQYVVTQIRPFLKELWNGFTAKEKNQFFKYIKPYWEVFRHRMPVDHLKLINKLKMENKLVISCQKEDVIYIDCTGFNKVDQNTFYKNLLNKKVIEKDLFGWGARSLVSNFMILGPLQKFERFEITAIKEIREEIKRLVPSI
jgi:uncharacterized NAD(P)/FAD-binding protein YdhS